MSRPRRDCLSRRAPLPSAHPEKPSFPVAAACPSRPDFDEQPPAAEPKREGKGGGRGRQGWLTAGLLGVGAALLAVGLGAGERAGLRNPLRRGGPPALPKKDPNAKRKPKGVERGRPRNPP